MLFEKLPYDSFGGKFTSFMYETPTAVSFVRDALKRGLALGRRLGTNPFKYGLVAGTDTHIAAAGYTDERKHPGMAAPGPRREASCRLGCRTTPSSIPEVWRCCGRRRTPATRSSRPCGGARPMARAARG